MSGGERNYLDIGGLSADPVEQFGRWFDHAPQAGQQFPETCCLSTATPDGKPSARMVLLKGFDKRGFVVFTNYNSRKAAELEANPHCALTFHWPAMGRQVRIEGEAARTSRRESKGYFDNRPLESRLGAWASNQSSPLAEREELMEKFEEYREKFRDSTDVPLPGFWGGYRIKPSAIEFWQQGPHRLHDRFRYTRDGAEWQLERLAP
ncbi:MAG: pyridoxamine 5'-phosphate oxidase [Candidatus Glassbacteria bacterium]|nr:pyridoxamine 5'-phosphate oxidase [Candidatus Glassbacteria bacterium]